MTSDNPRVVLSGLRLGESPRWHDGRLWLADWGTGQVLVVAGDGHPTEVAAVPGLPICFDWLPDGDMVIVSGPRAGCCVARRTGC